MNIHPIPVSVEWIEKVELSSPVHHLQTYNPLFGQFLPEGEKKEGRSVQSYYEILSLDKVRRTDFPHTEYDKPVHIKYSPLLDPLKYMIGQYDRKPEIRKQIVFPKAETAVAAAPATKYDDVNNASYVDAFFYFLSSRLFHDYGMTNAIDFYGTFLGVQEQFKMNILDDYEYLQEFDEFFRKMKLGEIACPDYPLLTMMKESRNKGGSRNLKPSLSRLEEMTDENLDLGIVDLDNNDGSAVQTTPIVSVPEMELEYEKVDVSEDESSEESSEYETVSGSSHNSSHNSSHSSDGSQESMSSNESYTDSEPSREGSESGDGDVEDEDGDGDESEEDESEDADFFVYIKDFPVQLICLEKCDGTLDSLFDKNEVSMEMGLAFAFQITMTLAMYQQAFSFTHNDLHSNNIVYKETDVEYLYYKYGGRSYRVPTYGKIMKIIDFGRSIYRFQEHKMTSDGFSPSGDAHTQYNTEPYYNAKKTRIDENPSFDLCRLGCSLYDFVMEDESAEDESTEDLVEDGGAEGSTINTNSRGKRKSLDEFQRLIRFWCLDDKGNNILYKESGEERYPNFKLYKMIARLVHDKQPEQQMRFFDCFLFEQPKEELEQPTEEPTEELEEDLSQQPLSLKEIHVSVDESVGNESIGNESVVDKSVVDKSVGNENEAMVEPKVDIPGEKCSRRRNFSNKLWSETEEFKSFRFSEKEGPWGRHYPWMDLDALPKFYTNTNT